MTAAGKRILDVFAYSVSDVSPHLLYKNGQLWPQDVPFPGDSKDPSGNQNGFPGSGDGQTQDGCFSPDQVTQFPAYFKDSKGKQRRPRKIHRSKDEINMTPRHLLKYPTPESILKYTNPNYKPKPRGAPKKKQVTVETQTPDMSRYPYLDNSPPQPQNRQSPEELHDPNLYPAHMRYPITAPLKYPSPSTSSLKYPVPSTSIKYPLPSPSTSKYSEPDISKYHPHNFKYSTQSHLKYPLHPYKYVAPKADDNMPPQSSSK